MIIFEEISHIVKNRKGIFVAKRQKDHLLKTIKNIMQNYKAIQEEMNLNQLPTKEEFFLKMTKILNKN